MGSSSSSPVRRILAEEGSTVIDNENQTGEDTLHVPEVESNYPEVKPTQDIEQKHSVRTTVTSRMTLSQRSIVPNIVGSVEAEHQSDDVSKAITKSEQDEQSISKSNITSPPTPKEGSEVIPARPMTTGVMQGYQLSALTLPNNQDERQIAKSVFHKTSLLRPGSLISGRVFSELDLKFDTESNKSMKQREMMLLHRERYEYQQLIAQASILPERSPRVQMPTKLSLAWDALQNQDYTDTSSILKQLDYTEADRKATEHKAHRAETYSSLVNDLTSTLENDALKVWAILSWISKQEIGRISFDKVFGPDTPNGYMQMIQENKGTFPVFFALLCRTAGIPCAVVNGLSKSSNYEVGSEDIDDLRNTWNTVFVEGGWRLVHPLWVCRSLQGHQQGGWLTIEKDGITSNKIFREEKGTEVATYNSYYIFTEPEEFAYRNFPDEPRWQLLKEPWTKEDFVTRAYLRPEFFKRNFKLLSENKCVLISEDGQPCNIVVGHSVKQSNDLVFTYDFSVRAEEKPDGMGSMLENEKRTDLDSTFTVRNGPLGNKSNGGGNNSINDTLNITDNEFEANATNLSDVNANIVHGFEKTTRKDFINDSVRKKETKLDKFVVVSKDNDSVRFEIRFVKKGTYRLRIYGGLFSVHGSDPPCIMHMRLDCLADIAQPKPIPFDPGIVGWGPGPVAERLGLFVPSHVNGIINVTKDEETVLQFILKRVIQVKVEMYHTETRETSLSRFIHYKIVELKETVELRIVILCPGKGEYAIKIDALSRKTNIMENACNYLVHTQKERPHEEYYTRKARRMLLEAMLDDNVVALGEAVEACKQYGPFEDDPEVRGGMNRLEFLQCRKALRESLLINRIDVTEQAIYHGKNSQFRTLLSRDIIKAERHLADLCELNEGGWSRHIPEIDRQSLFEMCRLRKPKDEIYQTMKAVYLLLGVDSTELTTWSQIQLLLRKGEDTLVEMARLEKYLQIKPVEIRSLDEETLEKVQEILDLHSEDDVRRIDNTAAAYYQWVVDVLSRLKTLRRRKLTAEAKKTEP